MNTIIKNITKVFLFLIILCFLLLIASYIFEPKTNNKEAGMRDVRLNAILGEKDNTLDVLFLGDSEVFSSISPMEIYNKHGFTSFVLGSAAQQLHYTKYLLSRTLKKQKPKVVILETNAIYRKIEPTGPIFRKLQNWFSIFEYHNRWKSLNFRDLNLSFNYEYNSEFKGYTYKPGIKGLKSWNYMNPTTESKEIESLNKKFLLSMIELCNEFDIKFILLSTPSTKNWNYTKHMGIKEFASEHNITYIDLNLMKNEVPIDWEKDTCDEGDHLNYYGAVKVSNFIGDYLANNYKLENKKDKPKYKSWNEALPRYFKAVGKF